MSGLMDANKFGQLAQKIAPQCKLLDICELTGGVSARVTVLTVLQPDGKTKKMVVREYGTADPQRNSMIAADEFRLLRILQTAGLPVPMPYYFDQSGSIFPTPYIVIEYIEGGTEFAPSSLAGFIRQLAAHLVKIHSIDGRNPDLGFLPDQNQKYSERSREWSTKLQATFDESQVWHVLEQTWPLPQPNPSVLLHGDFWPGNILWREDRIVAIVDWEDAAIGDPLADVANARLEILWAFGLDAMHSFTRHYRSLTNINFTNLAYWDLRVALHTASKLGGWGLDDATERAMREGQRLFVDRALYKIANPSSR